MKSVEILAETVERDFLPAVRKPARYIGGEVNQVKKDLADCEITVALCFPDIYEIAMSYAGLGIIYHILNKLEKVAAERVFLPWLDAADILRAKNIGLFSLESKAAVKDFDIVAFSLTNELCYTNVLEMLDLAGINLRTSQRTDDEPLIIAGGGMSNYCEPMADFIDMFVLGEGEEAVVTLVEFINAHKRLGTGKRQMLLAAAEKFEFVYVPALYKFEYENEKIKSFQPTADDLPESFVNAVVKDFDNAPVQTAPIVPFVQAVHERVSIEIMRGCPGRCRFCQASFCRRPIRYRSIEKILEIAKAAHEATGFDTLSLLSLSTADYPELGKLVSALQQYFDPKYVGISLPSLRVDKQLKLLPEQVTSVRKAGLTIAVEAASERLRKTINKPITDENLFAAIEAAYAEGFSRVKLYFMVGLAGETEEDLEKIVDLCDELVKLRRKVCGNVAQINAAVSWLVPKPHTPFGWLGQKPKDYFENAKEIILGRKRQLKAKSVQFKFHNIQRSIVESAVGRGDRRLGDVIEFAWQNGARFDLWDECFDYEIWSRAFAKFNMDLESAAQKAFARDEILPWQHLGGPEKDYLLSHFDDAIKQMSIE